MTFRSLATLLGGVPADVADTPGEPAGTRFVGFGEAMTSAIANRPHYALAENTDDLNTRVAIWETGGIDASYDLGTAAVTGGGRIINKDGGAIETESLLGTQYEDDPLNAHWRADMEGDTGTEGTGYDAVAGAAAVGFIDRIAVAIAADTIITTAAQPCTLASGGANRIRLDSGSRWKLTAATNLALGAEIVEVTGAPAAENGLYILSTFISDDTATFTKLDGTAAAFSAGTAVCMLYKRKFASRQYNSTDGALFHGLPGAFSALTLMSGAHNVADVADSGSSNVLSVNYRDSAGLVTSAFQLDLFGRLNSPLASDALDAETLDNWGGYAHWADKVASAADYEAGFLFSAPPTTVNSNAYGFTSLVAIDSTEVADGVAFDFTADTNEIDISGATTGTAFQQQIPIGSFFEILTPAAQAGFYWIFDKVGHDTAVIEVYGLDGAAVVFPTVGSGTARFYNGSVLGTRGLFAQPTGGAFPLLTTSTLPALYLQARNGLTVTIPGDDVAASGIRINKAGSGAGGNGDDQLLLASNSDGDFYIAGDMWLVSDKVLTYVSKPVRLTNISLPSGLSQHTTGDPNWDLNDAAGNNSWKHLTASGSISFPITLPAGASLDVVRAIVKHDTASPGTEISMRLYKRDAMNFGTVATGSSSQIGPTADGTTSGTAQIITITTGGEIVDNETTSYILSFVASTNVSGDEIFGIQIQWQDPGPRNH